MVQRRGVLLPVGSAGLFGVFGQVVPELTWQSVAARARSATLGSQRLTSWGPKPPYQGILHPRKNVFAFWRHLFFSSVISARARTKGMKGCSSLNGMVEISDTTGAMLSEEVLALGTEVTNRFVWIIKLFTCPRPGYFHFFLIFLDVLALHGKTYFFESRILFVAVRSGVFIFFRLSERPSHFHLLPALPETHPFEALGVEIRFDVIGVRRRRCRNAN